MTPLEVVDYRCAAAKEAQGRLAAMKASEKNVMLRTVADALVENCGAILDANHIDVQACKKPEHFVDRLRLDARRIGAMADGVMQLTTLDDPIGICLEKIEPPSGIQISKISVPLGVVGIIYEARPNVTSDAIGLCLKSGNAVVLRGSADALNSNRAIVAAIKCALEKKGFPSGVVAFVDNADRECARYLMRLNKYIDVLIPRGSQDLIDYVVQNATIPVIATGKGNCHIYVERSADIAIAEQVLLNAKLQRPTVCNAAESLLIDRKIADTILPILLNALKKNKVEIFGCPETTAIFEEAHAATDDDFFAEYLDYKISCKVVSGIYEAIAHINKYGSHHSDAIITNDSDAAREFIAGVDSATVYINASTRFTDGGEFGFGAEMGISNQKLHARGPMGLRELTSYKYIVEGNGNVRK